VHKDNKKYIKKEIDEDIGSGDYTTQATVKPHQKGSAKIISKQSGIIAGTAIAEHVFKTLDPKLRVKIDYSDGNFLYGDETVMLIEGNVNSILSAERTALNYLAHLSGIATLTGKFVYEIKGTPAKITDTRKTTPLLRAMEKEAVKAAGGINHRMGLYDMILIKENHILAAGGIIHAVKQTRRFLKEMELDLLIEVETRTLVDVREALTCRIDRIMLDNMNIDKIREAVHLVNKQVTLEASGGITLENVREIAETGVDYISIGALTHSAPAFDFSLLLEMQGVKNI
jgi:nicotinate-nucleotide pyrophosphorylase (carboxylating)